MKKLIYTLLVVSLAAITLTACTSGTQQSGESALQSATDSQLYGDNEEFSAELSPEDEDLSPDDETAAADSEAADGEESGSDSQPQEINEAFVGTWAPYAAYDADENKVSLTDIFGDNFNFGGSITLNSDGSFESNLTSDKDRQSGSFTTSDNTATLVYGDGEEVTMTLTGYPNSSTLEQPATASGKPCTVYYSN